ncbi:MAG TPA: DUF2232 domain-containing protein [Candidatus Binataceae bacterium]|nr:DUF2232 domain-containing protein [Candidatus Binataceae bacterium]
MRFKDALDLTRAAALAAALFLLGGLVPVVGALVMLCAPAPMLFNALRAPGGLRRLGLVLALSLGIIALVAGPLQSLGFALSLGLGAVLMTAMIRRQWPFELIVFVTTAATMTAVTVALVVLAGSPAALVKQLHDSLAAAMSHADSFYAKLGMTVSQSKEISGRVLELTTSLAPALAAMLGAVAVLINLGLVWRRLGKPGLGYQLFAGLTTWRTPDWLVWLLLATGFGLFLPLEPARIVAINGFVLVAAIYFCQGLAIMAYYLQLLAMPMLIRGIIYVIALLQPILAALVCLAGVFDLWVDFRRLKPPSQEAGSLDDLF